MATSYSISSTKAKYEGRYLKVSCTQTKHPGLGKSTIKWTLEALGENGYWYTTGPTTVKIGSKTVYYLDRMNYTEAKFPAAVGSTSGSFDVEHDINGNLSLTVSISTAIYYSAVKTNSGTWTLDNVPRSASITDAPNFTDEQNPTITYSNPAGNAVTTLQACIGSVDGKSIYVDYRDISKTGTSYTFQLTNDERVALRKIATKNIQEVRFYVKTVVGSNTYYSGLIKNLTIVNANPTLNPTVKDVGTVSLQLTGDENVVIKGYNNMQFSSGAAAVKEATIASQSVVCGSKSLNAGSGKLNYVDSGTFVFTVKDSRGNTATKTVTKSVIDYIPLSCTFDAKNPTADGEMTLDIKGNFFNGSFGAVTNALTVQYRIKKNNETYGSWSNVTVTKSSNTYAGTVKLTGLDYQSTYTIQARAQDTLNQKADGSYVTTDEKKFKTSPIFDWSDEDFAFNVPVNFPGGASMSAAGVMSIADMVLSQNGYSFNDGFGQFSTLHNVDANLYTRTGVYYLGTGCSNVPSDWIKLLVLGQYNNGVDIDTVQIAIKVNTNTLYWIRVKNMDTWYTWKSSTDFAHPVGSVIMTNTNTNPINNFGGSWTLIDKGFNPGIIRNPVTLDSTNVSGGTINVHRSDHTITITGYIDNKVAFTDSDQHLFDINLTSIGISAFPDTMRWLGYSDGGNSAIQMTMTSAGVVQKVDLEYNISSVAAGKTWVFSFTTVIDDSAMLDAACTRFYWRRDS